MDGGNSPASCVLTETQLLTNSPWVKATTSRIAALRSTTSFLGGAFLILDAILAMTSLVQSVSSTMQVSASLTSVTSGGLLSKNRSAAVAFVGRRNGLLDFMNNRGGELAHGNDSVGMR